MAIWSDFDRQEAAWESFDAQWSHEEELKAEHADSSSYAEFEYRDEAIETPDVDNYFF